MSVRSIAMANQQGMVALVSCQFLSKLACQLHHMEQARHSQCKPQQGKCGLQSNFEPLSVVLVICMQNLVHF
jgi:hypothetical protein